MDSTPDQDGLVQQFLDLTGVARADAQRYLEASGWDLGAAVSEFYTAQEEEEEEEGRSGAGDDAAAAAAAAYTGPRTLDGQPAPEAASTAKPRATTATAPRRGGIATLGSLLSGSSRPAHAHAHDDDDDDDDSDAGQDFHKGEPRDLFAGGEKSGLAVQDPARRQDPRKMVDDILKKAKANTPRPGEPARGATAGSSSRFHGSGQTLGGDDTPSQVMPSVRAPPSTQHEPVRRILHLWNDGFSVEDGPLKRFDDPAHAADLQMIRSGRAPLHLMGVSPDQPVDVQLNKHAGDYTAPAKKYTPFGGAGNRLGSPVPGAGGTTSHASPSASATSSSSAAASNPTASTPATSTPLDATQPTLSLRIQLADGTRLPARFNPTHTVGDIYDFIARATTDGGDRPWVVATTFPSQEHTDKTQLLGDMAEFRRGGTAVQKWCV